MAAEYMLAYCVCCECEEAAAQFDRLIFKTGGEEDLREPVDHTLQHWLERIHSLFRE
jgi:hypothetical protein